MRVVIVIAALVCAASAARAEDTRESRYGPTALRPSVSLIGSNYGGPVLGWAGKQEIAPPARAPAQAPTLALRPMATPWRQLGAVPQQQPAQQPYAQLRPAQPQQPQMAPPSAPQVPAPVAMAYAQPQIQAPAPYSSPAQLQGQVQGSRTYSVGRQYGMTPDAIPPVQPGGMIFIAPSDEPKAAKKDEEPRHGSAEWLAQAPMDAAEADDAKSGNN
jgi:hypothetical protein